MTTHIKTCKSTAGKLSWEHLLWHANPRRKIARNSDYNTRLAPLQVNHQKVLFRNYTIHGCGSTKALSD